jgi:hypothetical protein
MAGGRLLVDRWIITRFHAPTREQDSKGKTMGWFDKKEAEKQIIKGIQLHCEICKHDRFWHRQAQLNTAVATFFKFDWANASADCFVCEKCGYIHWFLPDY